MRGVRSEVAPAALRMCRSFLPWWTQVQHAHVHGRSRVRMSHLLHLIVQINLSVLH